MKPFSGLMGGARPVNQESPKSGKQLIQAWSVRCAMALPQRYAWSDLRPPTNGKVSAGAYLILIG